VADPDPIHFFLYGECLLRVPTADLLPKAGSLLLARHLPLKISDVVLDIGTGSGLVGLLAARAGHQVLATDVVQECCECARANAVLNGVADRMEVRFGDAFEPVGERAFDLIATNPPQMPTPPEREWGDAQSRADNGGPDGWSTLGRIIDEAPRYLKPGGRLVFTLFAFLGIRRALARLQEAGLSAQILAREAQPFPRIARERLEHLRTVDSEGALPPGRPTECERLILCGVKG